MFPSRLTFVNPTKFKTCLNLFVWHRINFQSSKFFEYESSGIFIDTVRKCLFSYTSDKTFDTRNIFFVGFIDCCGIMTPRGEFRKDFFTIGNRTVDIRNLLKKFWKISFDIDILGKSLTLIPIWISRKM